MNGIRKLTKDHANPTPRQSVGADGYQYVLAYDHYLELGRDLRAQAIAEIAAAAARKFRPLFAGCGRGFAAWRRRRQTYRELVRLDDRTLADIGLTRYEVEAMASGLIRPSDIDRRTHAAAVATGAVIEFTPKSAAGRIEAALAALDKGRRHDDRHAA